MKKITKETGCYLSPRNYTEHYIFTSAPKVKFYDELFFNLDLSSFPDTVCSTLGIY